MKNKDTTRSSWFSANYTASISQKNELESYKNLGEQQYLKIYENKFKKSLAEQPFLFLKKVFKRFQGITLIYYPYNTEYESKFLVWRNFIHALPFCCLLLLIIFRKNKNRYFLFIVLVYVFYLSPYMLVSYYIRYSTPLVPLQCLFVFWGIELFFHKRLS